MLRTSGTGARSRLKILSEQRPPRTPQHRWVSARVAVDERHLKSLQHIVVPGLCLNVSCPQEALGLPGTPAGAADPGSRGPGRRRSSGVPGWVNALPSYIAFTGWYESLVTRTTDG